MSPEGADWPWSVLGLDRMPKQVTDIRRAYARALKGIDQSTDIEGFTDLREAYEYAMAVREGRTAENQRRKEQRAAARAEAASEPPVEVPAPPPDPDALARQRKEADLNAWLRRIAEPSIIESRNAMVARLFNTPFPTDPETAVPIRYALAGMVRQRLMEEEENPDTKDPLTPETLRLLDRHYGWLSDYKAFQTDFHDDTAVLDLAVTRAFGPITPGAVSAPRKGWRGRFDRFRANGFPGWLVWLVVMISLQLLRVLEEDNPLFIGIVIAFALVVLWVVGLLLWSAVLKLKEWVTRLQDWIAIRRARRGGR